MIKNTFINKNGIYLMIGMCILLLSIVCLIANHSRNNRNRNNKHTSNTISREGFNMFDITKDTDYLEPVKETITDELWTILINKMNKEYPELEFTEEKIKEYTGFVTKAEINYYLSNNKFPWSNYVTNRFKELLTTSDNSDTESSAKIEPDEMVKKMMQNFPNRYAYKQYVISSAMKDSLTSDIYLIYSGEKPAPTVKPTTNENHTTTKKPA